MSINSPRRPRATRRLRSAAALTATALAASVAIVGTSAGTASAAGTSTAKACGYYEHGNTGYFGNCSGEAVTIEIDDWGSNSYACVAAHSVANLGSAWDIDDAWVIHAGCN